MRTQLVLIALISATGCGDDGGDPPSDSGLDGSSDVADGGGVPDSGAMAALSVLDGDAAYRPFQMALVDVPIDTVTEPIEGTLGDESVVLLPVHATLATFVVPDLPPGRYSLALPRAEIAAQIDIDPALDDGEATALAQDLRAALRADLEGLRDGAEPDEADLVTPATEALAELDRVEAELGSLSPEERRAFDHVLANLEEDARAAFTLDFEACRSAFWGSFRAKARGVIFGVAGAFLGQAIATGGITLAVGALIGGVSLALAISSAIDAVEAGVEMIAVCFEATVDLASGERSFSSGVSEDHAFDVTQTWLYGPARDLLESLQAAAARLTALPGRWLDRLTELSADDHALEPLEGGDVTIVDIEPPSVTGAAEAGPDGTVTLTFETTAPPGTVVGFTVRVRYAGTEGLSAIAATVTQTCGDGSLQAHEECDGANLGGAACGAGEFADRAGSLSCGDDCTVDETACVAVCGELGAECCGAAPRCEGALACESTCVDRGSASASLSAALAGTFRNAFGDEIALPRAPSGTSLPPGTYTFSGMVTSDFPDTCDVDIGDPISGTVTLDCGVHHLIEPEGGCGANLVANQVVAASCRGPCLCP